MQTSWRSFILVGSSLAISLGLVLTEVDTFAEDPVVPSPPAEMTGATGPTGTVPKQLSKSDGASLLREFLKAQKSELKALEHRQKLELQGLKAAQNARLKEWKQKEREARSKYFAEHTKGPERRAYVKDERERYSSLQALFKDERAQREREHEVRRKAVMDDQVVKLKEFQELITRSEYPPAKLWPASGQ